MARNLCDFYVLSSTGNLAAKYVNAVLTQVEAQHTANALHKQHGAFVCGIDKGPASGPPRAPIKSPNMSMPGNLPACWVQAGNSPQVKEQPKTSRYSAIQSSKGTAPQLSPLAPVLSTSFLKPQLIAGAPAQGAKPMFRWIEKSVPVRDARAIEARLRGIGRDEDGEGGGKAGPYQTKKFTANPNGKGSLSGAQVGLGAAPWLIKKWFPERTDAEWDGLDDADKHTFLVQANAVEAQWNAKISEMRANGACDATKPGLLAGAMREYLLKNGGKTENMDDVGSKEFGPKDCKEWVRVFGSAPSEETVAKAIGLATGGTSPWVKNSANGHTLQITLKAVCPNGFKLPSCPQPGSGAPKDPCAGVTCPPGQHCENGKCVADPVKPAAEEPKKSSWLWLLALVAGGLAVAGAAGLFPKAPKIPPRAAER